MGLVVDEVIGPDVVRPLRAQPDAGTVIEPEPGPFRLLLGDPGSSPGQALEPFAPPDPLDPLVVHMPACVTEHGRDTAIPVSAVLAGQFDDVGGQPVLIVAAPWNLAARVERCWPSVRQTLRSETLRVCRTRSMQRHRREGLSSFPS